MRRGGPISPYIFILLMEAFSGVLEGCVYLSVFLVFVDFWMYNFLVYSGGVGWTLGYAPRRLHGFCVI